MDLQGQVGLLAVIELVHKHQALFWTNMLQGLEIKDIGGRNGGLLNQSVAHIHRGMPLVAEPDVILALGSPAGVFVSRVFGDDKVVERGFTVFDGAVALLPRERSY